MSDPEPHPDAGDAGSPPPADPPAGDPSGPEAAPDEAATEAGADGAEGPVADDPAEFVEFTLEQIDALVAERDQFRDAYQRTAADFDNYRKQSQKRIADEVARTQGGFVERLLPVLDAVEAARSHGSTDVEAVASALFDFLGKEGLERVHPAGEVFDPNVADAVLHEPAADDETTEPTVTEVLRTGYLWNGRVIRPAMVKVAG